MIVMLAIMLTSAQSLTQEVRGLGPQSDVRSLERIAQHGCRAVPLLVANLRPVNLRKATLSSTDVRAMKLVWSIAALRYVTGQEFRSNILSNSDPVGQKMLSRGGSGGKIYGVWMSREIVYFNSVKAQREVIAKWERYSRSGVCRPGYINTNISFWMYGDSGRGRSNVGGDR